MLYLESSEPIFIKNLENVQGDERDVILFSVGYGPDKDGKVSLNFVPLNREGGWRRLNVAVTRARYEMKVYSTLRADQIDITHSASEGIAGIKAFLEYAEKGRSTLAIRKSIIENNQGGFEKILAEKIRKQGYEVHTNIGCSGYRIDIGIVNKAKPSEYILGILCDGNNYHAAKTANDREIIQQEVLKLLGWNIHKIWSTDWWENANRVMDDTLKAIKNAEENIDKIIEPDLAPSYTPAIEKTEPIVFNNIQPAEVVADIKNNFAGNLYSICNLDIVRSTSSDDFLQYHNTQQIEDQIQQVLDIEAPIMRNLLAKRVLSA